jgi:TolA-binding protein
MSRVTAPTDAVGPARESAQATEALGPLAPAAVTVRGLQQELATLQREVVSLRTQRQRDMATLRGLGEALQSLRRGAMALRSENEDLRRQLDARPQRRR